MLILKYVVNVIANWLGYLKFIKMQCKGIRNLMLWVGSKSSRPARSSIPFHGSNLWNRGFRDV